jgi:hypothetical protein
MDQVLPYGQLPISVERCQGIVSIRCHPGHEEAILW